MRCETSNSKSPSEACMRGALARQLPGWTRGGRRACTRHPTTTTAGAARGWPTGPHVRRVRAIGHATVQRARAMEGLGHGKRALPPTGAGVGRRHQPPPGAWTPRSLRVNGWQAPRGRRSDFLWAPSHCMRIAGWAGAASTDGRAGGRAGGVRVVRRSPSTTPPMPRGRRLRCGVTSVRHARGASCHRHATQLPCLSYRTPLALRE